MGREAGCHCRWGEQEGACKVLHESGEIVFRGAIRRRALLSSLRDISVVEGQLTFLVSGERVALQLGSGTAEKWAKAIAVGPPTLAKKLGLSKSTRVLLLGGPRSKELEAALEQAGSINEDDANLIVACVSMPSEVHAAIERSLAKGGIPLWMIYTKGKSGPISEAAVRDAMRGRGFVDVKVAAVSATLTAMRFARS